ncbi:diaminopimelate decarboxylase [Calidifontibacter sp. DB0510]|uniref:Diaminopimelate decarboxylase n=1 Tax=Metallococcus carri TaxID=1656884 RepID=A0A967B1P4_9MICO|nr:diaminopimelate decarboxylase [Metallococcus carri]NHN56392.1 diaminopimelate decarboxylase [Metallococcus carri]NOP36016.1 diaminopimelate decarboxylase [Calidifontibacter sp. DB2511S]
MNSHPVFSAGVCRTADGALALAGHDLRAIAQIYGTPAYLVDVADARARARAYRDAFRSAFDKVGAPADVYYAGKAFLCTAMARLVHDEGLRLDVCSGGELAVARRAGIPGELIGLHGNNKSTDEINAALDYGVGRIVLDSFEEIDRVAAAAAERDVIAPVMIRVKAGVEAHTHEFIATAHEDQKFGFSLTDGQVGEAITRVLEAPNRLRLLGFHSHIGSQIFESDGFRVAAQRLIELQLQVAREHGVQLPELDLGGGFGIAYLPTDDPLAPQDMADQLARIVADACSAAGMPVPRVSVEPGRSIIGPAGMTLYTVGTVKPVRVDDDLVRTYVAVDGGMSDNPRPVLYDAQYYCELADRTSEAAPVLARVVGKHCESGDIVVRDVELPGDVHAGDLIAVGATGAYCRSLASTYNHVPRPPVLAVTKEKVTTWLRRETIDDLLALEGNEQ